MSAQERRMPDFARSFYGFHHTVDSALDILDKNGLPAARVTVRMAGLGAPDRWVVRQLPEAGAVIDGATKVELWVSGLGYFETLPVGMWHRGTEAEPGVDDVVRVFDDPLQKAVHWVREGARLFDVRPDNRAACARWMRLFGLDPEQWPPENWFPLAVLLPYLARNAGTEEGIRTALQTMLGLPLQRLERKPGVRSIPERLRSALGEKASRLGIDAVAGDRVEDLGELRLHIGPTALATYYDYHQERPELLESVLRLVMPCYQNRSVAWVVLDPTKAPRLGIAEQNSRLGLNTHLGAAA